MHKSPKVTWSQVSRVLLACTVFIMYSAMLRIYHDPVAPHDMYPGLDSCRHIQHLSRYQYDGEYLLRSDVVAQLALMWSQSNCSRYAGLLSNSQEKAATLTTAGASSGQSSSSRSATDRQGEAQQGHVLEAADPLDGLSSAASDSPALLVALPIAWPGNVTSGYARGEPAFSSRADDVPSPPPRARGRLT